MIAITEYTVEQFGITLPNACIEIREVNTAQDNYYHTTDENGNGVMRNTIVRYKVWADHAAYLAGASGEKQPITEGVKYVDFTPANKDAVDNIALNIAFPESTIS